MRGHRDLRRMVAGAVACGLLALLVPVAWISLLFLAPLAFFLPGYAIASATFASRPPKRPQMLALSLGLSLATLALAGLVLDLLPGGLRAGPWTLLLVLVVFGAARAAAVRRSRHPGRRRRRAPLRLRPDGIGAALIAVGSVAAVAALVLTFSAVAGKHAVGYTELWLQPLRTGHGAAVRIGVGSDEQTRVRYSLDVRYGDGREQAVPPFSLKPGETKVVRLQTVRRPGDPPLPVVASLFRQDRPASAYRRAWGWLPSPSPAR